MFKASKNKSKLEKDDIRRERAKELEDLRLEIAELKLENQRQSAELLKYESQAFSISNAIIEADLAAKKIIENSKIEYSLEISKIKALYSKWSGMLNDLLDLHPKLKKDYSEEYILESFRRAIEEAMGLKAKRVEVKKTRSKEDIRSILKKMNNEPMKSNKPANFSVNNLSSATTSVHLEKKLLSRKEKPSTEASEKLKLSAEMNREKMRVDGLKPKIRPIFDIDEDNDGRYEDLVDKFLNDVSMGEDRKAPYAAKNTYAKKDNGFDLQQAVTPKDSLEEIMKSFNLLDD